MDKWNSIYRKYDYRPLVYDDWLDKFSSLIEKSRSVPIIDLGCGTGNDTLYLKDKGYRVISCDFSSEALNRLDYFIENPEKKLFDMREKFPFPDNSASVAISDLSLHYFSKIETDMIIRELARVLENSGTLICRVNSTNDINHGAGQGEEIEKNFYNYNGSLKRFFDKCAIKSFFDGWKINYINECEMLRYKKRKIVWEFTAENIKP
ncbi:MAG: class I SAM-dependent methyltransferase [Spirochaetia bacterium]|jgi:ubiquinone/menaquinone biosynthesis C-methylase UbiE|nr:class I SAM-dependent methyltransferase [Spirochaetia bacterium]